MVRLRIHWGPLARVWRPPGPVVFAEVCYYA